MVKAIAYGMSTLLGESETSLAAPVFFDPHYPILINKPPVTLITGSPGSGKTFSALIMAAQSSVLGKLTFCLDPKGDFIALKKLEDAGVLQDVNIWSIFSDIDGSQINESNYGLLDPLQLTNDRAENIALTVDTIKALVQNVSNKQSTSLIPIVQDVAESSDPSLSRVVRKLQQSQDDDIRALGLQLDVPMNMAISKLLVNTGAPNTENIFTRRKGLTVINLMGLNLPSSDSDEKAYSVDERLSTVIMRLITLLVLDAMKSLPKKILKTLFIDEAWVVFGNAAGAAMIDQAALLGRSLNMATILATQSPTHIASRKDAEGRSSLDTTISTRLAFRNDSLMDNALTRKSLRLPDTQDNGWEDLFTKLDTGQCVFKDCRGGLAIIHTIAPDSWARAFDTNPANILKEHEDN